MKSVVYYASCFPSAVVLSNLYMHISDGSHSIHAYLLNDIIFQSVGVFENRLPVLLKLSQFGILGEIDSSYIHTFSCDFIPSYSLSSHNHINPNITWKYSSWVV